MVLLSLKAGLRAIEITGLTWGCLRENDKIIELVTTKGGERRKMPVNKELRAALKDYRETPRIPLTPTAVAVWFHDFYTGWEGYSSHSGRRTFATNAARKATTVGGSLRDVQALLGHASLNTTQRNLEPSSEPKRELVELI